jgi:hypothetical protein
VKCLELFERNLRGEPVSGIANGTMYVETLAGKKYALRTGHLLRLGRDRFKGVILGLAVSTEAVKLRFYGDAGRVDLGSAGAMHDLAPSLLEWIRTNHELTLFWTTLSAMGALLLSGLKLMGVLDRS